MTETPDDFLTEELRALGAEVDPVPARVLAAARGSFTWRTIDAELAALAYDSAVDAEHHALVRGGSEPRLLTFESDGLTVEVEVTEVGDRRRLIGQLVPPAPGVVEVRHPGGVVSVEADEVGRFTAEPIEPGPVSLRCRRTGDGEGTVATEWVTL